MSSVFRFIFMACMGLMVVSCSRSYEIIRDGASKYSHEGYYRLVSGITESDIRFYIHDSQLYLDKNFKDPVAVLYEGDGIFTTEYKGKTYKFKSDDLKVLEVAN